MAADPTTIVAVTGASGFIGTHLCANLLAAHNPSYTVRAAVRQDVPEKTAHLRALASGDGRLEIFTADMRDEGAYDALLDGCSILFHVAGNFGTEAHRWMQRSANTAASSGRPPPIETLMRRIKGEDGGQTNNNCESYDHAVYESYLQPLRLLLKSVERSKSARRIIYTSSGAAGGVVSSDCSSDTENDLDAAILEGAYGRAKRDCEKLLYQFGQEHGIICASSCPCIVLGPLIQSPLHDTVYQHRLADMIQGRYVLDQDWDVVDVRDIAQTQRLMAEYPDLVNGTRFWNGTEPAWSVRKILKYVQTECIPQMTDAAAVSRVRIVPPSSETDAEDDNSMASSRSSSSSSTSNESHSSQSSGSSSGGSSSSSFGESAWDSAGTTTWSDPVRVLGLNPRTIPETIRDTVSSLEHHKVLGRTWTEREYHNYYTVAEMDGCPEEMDFLERELTRLHKEQKQQT